MKDAASRKPLRLWPGAVIVVLSLISFYVPSYFAPATPAMLFGMMGSLFVGTLLVFVWWLFFSRARWSDRLGGLAVCCSWRTMAAIFLARSLRPRWSPWCPGFLGFARSSSCRSSAGRRAVTVVAVLVASLGWTLVRTDGVSGTIRRRFRLALERHGGRAVSCHRTRARCLSAPVASAVTSEIPSDPAVLEPAEAGTEAEAFETSAWPGFRGPARDNVLAGVTDRPELVPEVRRREIWRRPVGPGWGSFALVGNRLCTQEQRDEDEVVVCYDAATGEPIWLHSHTPPGSGKRSAAPDPRATPTYHDGRLYTLGATGVLNCLDVATGEPAWTRNIADDSGAPLPEWGFASSPLIVDDRVVVAALKLAGSVTTNFLKTTVA